MKYNVGYEKRAIKELLGFPKPIQALLRKRIIGLETVPPVGDIRKLHGFENSYRLRVSNYRVIYVVNDSNWSIRIMSIKHRKDAYRKF